MPHFLTRIFTEFRRDTPASDMQRTRRVLERRGSTQRLSLFDSTGHAVMVDHASSIDRPILAPSLVDGEEVGERKQVRARRRLSKRQRGSGGDSRHNGLG
ncbi:hypothetical protein BDU57DRAFT_74821 [Ampelomyces quisqualis]|uniref:Uncharacterized protein n=1 Tax=Ampelomyces quisqualis TaxID=50730 RepID=A0A6A5Q960_AMPQU|nr:hypothetical protein BDU57DRAFT_74821 [Ampelomyces quisqualis]